MHCTLDWQGRLGFTAKVRTHSLTVDAKRLGGGDDRGPSPKELVLVGAAGCTGMDVAAWLRKHKAEPDQLDVSADAEQTGGEPAVFSRIHFVYRAVGGTCTAPLLIEAVQKSQTLYCGVNAMLAKTAQITYDVYFDGAKLAEGRAEFAGV